VTLCGNSPSESAAEVAFDSGSHHRLVAKLMATVRPGFRVDIVRFDPADPVFGGPPCRVLDCRRPARSRDLCLGHHSRWREYGRPDLQEFAATADPRFAREVLLACQVPGCRYGVNGHGLCGRHLARWRQARRPNLAGWLASLPVEDVEDPPATCPVPGCGLWRQPRWPFCRSHGRSWIYHGRPDVGDYVSRFDESDDYATGVPAYEHIDLRGLPTHLKLEVQYALQRRRDDEKIKTPFGTVRGVVRFLLDNQLTSFMDWSEQTWRHRLTPTNGNKNAQLALALYAHRVLHDLLDGRGWEVEYPRDTWRLRNLGIDGPRATIAFATIGQPWLKELAKRWTRWRLSTGLGPQQASYAATTLARFSAFLTEQGVDALAQVDRALLECFLAELRVELAEQASGSHGRHIGQLNAFFDAIRRHGWDDTLPANAAFHSEDFPRPGYRPPRALSEHVMAQLEDPTNLDRWDNPAFRLITVILMRCGLRISSVLTLAYDCIARDADGAPYLRYVNTKMKREALVPIDDTIVERIGHQQQRLQQQWPNGTPILFPRPKANLRGDRTMDSQYYREGLAEWLQRCDIRDEHGRPAHVTPHQWRHTLGTRLINRDVPQEVVRRILDHDSPEMTSHYARLHDTTVREYWERAHKVNAKGETVTLDPDGPLAEAAWAKQRLSRATQALPNGYCGLPLVQQCPHANSCLTCPMFLTTTEFLPQHRAHRQQTLQIISTAQARGQLRQVEMNRQVADNLNRIITTLDNDSDGEQAEGKADAC
jgi:integrase